ncbi:hypothetical protein GALL_443880 [mine drainage metagenome]|uniref:Uncharacterized protein n=1 Tax=mine drainage metagenome TaxID=410659 RepID=A0A1J5PT21_9ZZZZ
MLHEIPMPGDAVRLDGNFLWLKEGAIGVIGGHIGEARDSYFLTFSASAYRQHQDHGSVSCSGGPVPQVGIDDLIPTGETISQRFWRFKGGEVRAHNGEDYWLDVPLWSWTPQQLRAKVDAALGTARFWEREGAPGIIDAVRARAFLAVL